MKLIHKISNHKSCLFINYLFAYNCLFITYLFASSLHPIALDVLVRYSSVSLSPTLGKNEKVEQHIKKKTHKPNALRFRVESGVIPLYKLTLVSFLFEISSVFLPRILPTSGIRTVGLRLGRVQFDLVSKVFLMVISGKCVTYRCVNDGTSEGVISNVLSFEIASAQGGVYQCGGVTLT